ncbi:ATP-binding protein, partial [Actinomadura sediminis]
MITDRGRLVGRREQLALVDAAYRDAEAGEPRFVLFAGDAGIGKTRLMEHVAERLGASGARVLQGGCVELGAEGLPLAPVTAMLRTLVREFGRDGLDGLAPGAAALTRLLPGHDLPPPDDAAAADVRDEPDAVRARSFELFAAVLERLGGERPLVLVVDDLHWADPSTRDLLGFLARRLRGVRVLALLAFRTDALGRRHPLRAFAAELARLPAVRRIDLPPLDRAETAELLAAAPGAERPAEALVDRVYRESGGNPLFAVEVARAAGAGLPDTLRDLLLRRFAELPDAARDVVRLAAAGGPRVAHGLLARVSGRPAPELLAALRAATDAHVLVPDGEDYAFPHTLLYEAVVDDLLPAERTALHRAYAAALEHDPARAPPDGAAAEAAFHWAEPGDAGHVLPALLRAAEAAGAVQARAEQARLLGRALEFWPPDGTAARFAAVERSLTSASWAGEFLWTLDVADRELVEETDPGRVAMLHAHRGIALHNLGRDAALTAVDEALRELGGDGVDPLPRARALDMAAAVCMLRDRPERALDAATEAMRLAADLDEPGLHANAATTAATVLANLGRYREALDALPEPAEDPACAYGSRIVQTARVELNRAEVLAALGRQADAAGAAVLGLALARAAGLAPTLGALL